MRVAHAIPCLLALAALTLPPASAAERVIQIEAGTNADGSMYLKPDDVTVDLGDHVTLRVKNVDAIFHDVALLSYDGEDIENEVPARSTSDKSFTATVPGNFRLVCEVSGHKQKGMQGMLHVVDPNKKAPGVEGVAILGLLAMLALATRGRR